MAHTSVGAKVTYHHKHVAQGNQQIGNGEDRYCGTEQPTQSRSTKTNTEDSQCEYKEFSHICLESCNKNRKQQNDPYLELKKVLIIGIHNENDKLKITLLIKAKFLPIMKYTMAQNNTVGMSLIGKRSQKTFAVKYEEIRQNPFAFS